MEYDLIALSCLAVSDAKVLFDVSKEKLDDPSIAVVLYQLWIAQLKLCGHKKLDSTRFSMSIVLDDSDANRTDLRILHEVALDVSIKAAIVVIAADILKICQLLKLNSLAIESHPSILSQSCDHRDSKPLKESKIGLISVPVIADPAPRGFRKAEPARFRLAEYLDESACKSTAVQMVEAPQI